MKVNEYDTHVGCLGFGMIEYSAIAGPGRVGIAEGLSGTRLGFDLSIFFACNLNLDLRFRRSAQLDLPPFAD